MVGRGLEKGTHGEAGRLESPVGAVGSAELSAQA